MDQNRDIPRRKLSMMFSFVEPLIVAYNWYICRMATTIGKKRRFIGLCCIHQINEGKSFTYIVHTRIFDMFFSGVCSNGYFGHIRDSSGINASCINTEYTYSHEWKGAEEKSKMDWMEWLSNKRTIEIGHFSYMIFCRRPKSWVNIKGKLE